MLCPFEFEKLMKTWKQLKSLAAIDRFTVETDGPITQGEHVASVPKNREADADLIVRLCR